MSAFLLPNGKQAYTTVSGAPLVGGKVYTYAAGTTTPKATYTSASGLVANTNPVILDTRGEAAIFFNGAYKVKLTDSLGNELWTEDNLVAYDIPVLIADLQEEIDDLAVATKDDLAALTPFTGRPVAVMEYSGGFFAWVEGAFTDSVDADTLRGIYVASDSVDPSLGCWVRNWDGTNGDPIWFGAVPDDTGVDNVAPLEACFAICQTTNSGTGIYYTQSTLTSPPSGHNWFGAYGSRDGPGTIIKLTGSATTAQTVFKYGAASAATVDDTINKAIVRGIQFERDGTARASTSTDPINAVRGVEISYLSDSKFESCTSLNSPVGFFVTGVVNSDVVDCTFQLETAGGNTANDVSVGFLVGGYAAKYGFLGANASIYLKRCRGFTVPSGYTYSAGMKLFGFIADSYIDAFEMSLMKYGVVVDGSDAAGVAISNAAGPGSCQDVKFTNKTIIDQTSTYGVWIRNLNDFGKISFDPGFYCTPSTTSTGVRTDDTGNASITFDSGEILCSSGGTGMDFNTGNTIQVKGTHIRDAASPLKANTVGVSDLSPSIEQISGTATSAIALTACFRSRVYPLIGGAAATIARGVDLVGVACTQIEVNCTAINPGTLAGASAANKVWYNGAQEASAAYALFGTGNLKTGALT